MALSKEDYVTWETPQENNIPWEEFPKPNSYYNNTGNPATEPPKTAEESVASELLNVINRAADATLPKTKEDYLVAIEHAKKDYQSKVSKFEELKNLQSGGISYGLQWAAAKIEMEQAYSYLNDLRIRFNSLFPEEKKSVVAATNPVGSVTTEPNNSFPWGKLAVAAGGVLVIVSIVALSD